VFNLFDEINSYLYKYCYVKPDILICRLASNSLKIWLKVVLLYQVDDLSIIQYCAFIALYFVDVFLLTYSGLRWRVWSIRPDLWSFRWIKPMGEEILYSSTRQKDPMKLYGTVLDACCDLYCLLTFQFLNPTYSKFLLDSFYSISRWSINLFCLVGVISL